MSILVQIYGTGSPQVELLKQINADLQVAKWGVRAKPSVLADQCKGVLRSVASDIRDKRLPSLQRQYQGEVFVDLLNLAKESKAEGHKDVAAVLACAALEDMLKRFALSHGLEVDDEELPKVINALKAAGHVSSQKSALLKGMVGLRNRALHAQWDKVEVESVGGVIGFVEEFLVENF